MFHDEQANHGANDHREVGGESKVADALTLARWWENQCRECRRCRCRHGEDDAVEQAQPVEHRDRRGDEKECHNDEEQDADDNHEPPLVDGVDENARTGARSDRADLEEGHGETCLDVAASVLLHHDDGECRDHCVLGQIDEEADEAHAQKFARPECFLCCRFIHVIILFICETPYLSRHAACFFLFL